MKRQLPVKATFRQPSGHITVWPASLHNVNNLEVLIFTGVCSAPSQAWLTNR